MNSLLDGSIELCGDESFCVPSDGQGIVLPGRLIKCLGSMFFSGIPIEQLKDFRALGKQSGELVERKPRGYLLELCVSSCKFPAKPIHADSVGCSTRVFESCFEPPNFFYHVINDFVGCMIPSSPCDGSTDKCYFVLPRKKRPEPCGSPPGITKAK
ncbi:MAG: hypothetical protein A2W03_14420 [Candidatus Aminicenantes bacterium RBG_16_63_16]|nr:MAG: hypothetical protein A2W03_14420 [Candidatus Aminicenantes bacterium RBG_16_63_16]